MLFFLSLAGVLMLRLLPRWGQRDFGVDTWYFLLSARDLRRQKKIPHRMPYYLLDIEEQWYPPLFSVLLSLFEPDWLARHQRWISPVIETLHAALAGMVAGWLAGPAAALTAIWIYGTWPILTAQHTDLNSRAFGSWVLTLQMLCLWALWQTPTPLTWAAACGMGVILLFSHKLATQQWIVLSLGLSCVLGSPRLAVAAALAPLAAWLVSGGFYAKVLKGHLEILLFWRKHLPYLGAHQVYQSPVYADPQKAQSRLGVRGLRSRPGAYRLSQLYMALPFPALWMIWKSLPPSELSGPYLFLLGWFGSVYATILVISYGKPVRFLGEGFRYGVYAAFPLAVLAGGLIWSHPGLRASAPWIIAAWLAVGFYLDLVIVGGQRQNTASHSDPNFKQSAQWLQAAPGKRILCLPIAKCDPIACQTGKQVLMGGHSAGYDRLEPFFPVLRRPLETFVQEYQVDHLLIDTRYVDPADLKLPAEYRVEAVFGPYQIFDPGKVNESP